MVVAYTLLFGLIGLFWRPWLGGSFKKISRIWKLLVLVIIVCGMYYTANRWPSNSTEYGYMLWSYLWFMRFWNHTHGDYFKVNSTNKDQGRSKWVDWCLRQIYGVDGYYNFRGNVTGLFLGYTAPAILATVLVQPHWYFILGGFVIAFVYGLMGKLFPTKHYSKYAEYISGALCFMLYYITIVP